MLTCFVLLQRPGGALGGEVTLGYLMVKSKGSAGRREAQVSHTDLEWSLGVDADTSNAALANVSKSGRACERVSGS